MRSVCPWRNPPSRVRGIAIWTTSAPLTPGVTTPRTESGFQARIRKPGTELSAASNRNTPCPRATSDRRRRNRRSCCWASKTLTTIPSAGRNPSAMLTPSARPNPSTPSAAAPRPEHAACLPIPPRTPPLATQAHRSARTCGWSGRKKSSIRERSQTIATKTLMTPESGKRQTPTQPFRKNNPSHLKPCTAIAASNATAIASS